MSFILFFILAVFILVLTLILSLVRGVSSLFFGRSSYSAKSRDASGDYEQYNQASESSQKIFSKEEGEYVSYEEIKE